MSKIIRSEDWWIAITTTIILPIIGLAGIKININDILAIILPIVAYLFGVTLVRFKALSTETGSIFYKSRKWWITVINTLIMILNRLLNINIDPSIIYPTVMVVISYVIGESLVDLSNIKKSTIEESLNDTKKPEVPDNPL